MRGIMLENRVCGSAPRTSPTTAAFALSGPRFGRFSHVNAPESEAQRLVGAVLNGRFRLIKLLGEGGMGAVYEAESVRGEGKRAIKVLHRELAGEEQIRARFFAEAEAARSLVHPNVVRVEGGGTAEDGSPYLVMELLSGMPLATLMDTKRIIPPNEAVPMMLGVLTALGHAHNQRVVHRDLKPDNVFLVPDGRGGMVPKLLDFGIAKVMDLAGGLGAKTKTGMLLGTPGYMGPEQIKNAKGVDARSDLWSMGVIFYEMLTGRMPFHAETEFARLTAVLTEPMTPIERVRPDLAAWSPFFQRALSKDLQTRFSSADEMARALIATAQATGAMPPTSAALPSTAPAPQAMQVPVTAPGSQAMHVPSTAPAQASQGVPVTAPNMMQSSSPMSGPTPPPHSYPPPQGAYPQAQPYSAMAGAPGASPGPTLPAQQRGGPGATHISGDRPAGVPMPGPSGVSGQIAVVDAPPLTRSAPLWVVFVVGFVCLGLGFVIGFLVAG